MKLQINFSTKILRMVLTILFSGIFVGNMFAQLSGTKTINASGGDYSSFNAAISALTSQGVNGPVVFNVANGTYNEQVIVPEITGASAVNTITFQSASGDSASVILTYNSTVTSSNFTLKLNNSDYIKLRRMTLQASGTSLGRVIELEGTSTNILIENCRFFGNKTYTNYNDNAIIFSYQDPTDQITLQKNYFFKGSYGVFFQGVSSTVYSTGTKILSNVFSDQYQFGVYLYYQNAPVINSNSIQLSNTTATGIALNSCSNILEVQKNKINLSGGDFGVYLSSCIGSTLARGLIVNNFVSITGGGTASGIYLSNSTYQNVYHNSVNISAITSNDYGAFFLTGGSNIDVRNNIFANSGKNYAYNIKTPSALEFSDNNNYYSNANYLTFWGSPLEDLTALKAAQAPLKDANSISFNPVFTSASDLHGGSFRIDNKGVNLGITTDIDGQTRTTYDVGADEFTGTGAALVAGTYTIGGTSPNYASFSLAATVLNTYGINGNVTFNVRNGSYTEQFTLGPIAGTSASNKILFQPESGDSTKVEISMNSGINNNFLVRFTGADYVTFRKLSFTPLNSTNSRIFVFEGSSGNNNINSCILNGNNDGSTYDALIYSYENVVNNLTIYANLFSGGRYGVYLNSNSANIKLVGTKIQSNIFSSQKGYSPYSIYLRFNDAPEVLANIFTNSTIANYYGIYLQDCSNDLKVLGNKINSNNSDGGIILYNCKSINTKRGLVANNFIEIGGASNAYGIYLYGGEYQNIYQNSVKISTSNISTGRAFYNAGNSNNINIKNNLFTNFGDGYAFYSETATTNFVSDYNDFFSTGNYPVFWNGVNYNSLSAYKVAASPLDVNSIWANPVFLSPIDLHAQSSFINNKGVALTEVTADFDGQVRSLSTPDIGADEFSSPLLPLAGGTYTIGGVSPSYNTFSLAVNDLNTRGISGPVVFNIRDGSYNEQMTLLDINGSSPTNTILFQPESGDSSKVEMVFSANINNTFIIQLTGTDYITFRKLTFSALNPSYSLVFNLRGGIQKLNIQNCIINGNGETGNVYNTAAIYSKSGTFTDLLIENCNINSGSSGIWFESPQNSQSTGTKILNSSFIGQNYNSIYLKYHDAPILEKNLINNTTAYTQFVGLQLSYCNNDLSVQGNSLILPNGANGIFLENCTGNTSKKGLVSNNQVDVGGTYVGSGIYTNSSDYQRIYFNSVRITSSDIGNGRAYYNYQGSNIDVRNNIFTNVGGGYAYYTNLTTSVVTSDYNDLFTTGNYLAYWGASTSNLNSFRTLSGKETNSISVNPAFNSSLRTSSSFINNKGTNIAAVTKDVDGEIRSASTPDLGADEYVPSESPLTGIYTIGGASPSYTTFNQAATALNERGVSGPVTFNIRNGTYDEQFVLNEVPGSSAVNNIVFQSETGDSSKVILAYNSTSAGLDYLIKLIGTDYLTIRKLTLAGTNTTYSGLFILQGNVSQLTIQNNLLSVNDNSTSYSIFSADGNYLKDISISHNTFLRGNGINLNGFNSQLSTGIKIENNLFANQRSYAIYLYDADSPVIRYNDISASTYIFNAIYLYNCDGKMNISENRIFSDNYATGIYLNYCDGTLISQGVISNNFVTIAGNSYAIGISINNSVYQNVLYNTVNIATSYSSTNSKYAFYLTGGDNVFVKNNIFANTTGGYAYYVATTNAVDASDFNDYFSTTDIAYWDGTKATLAALRTANSADAGSISANPQFVSLTDLRVKQSLLYRAATPSALVTQDIFGLTRDAVKPDIGATAFYCTTPVIDITTSTSCFGDSTAFIYDVTQVSVGSNYSFDFDNDFNPDTTFFTESGTIRHLFPASGSKTVNLIVSQIAGCNDYAAENIIIEPSAVLEVIATGAYCAQDNGSATVDINGAGPFIYHWSTGEKTSSISNLAKGSYSVSVKNQNNCVSTASFRIDDRIVVTVNELSPSTCGQSDGKAIVSVSGGTEPYSYAWTNGETVTTANKLPSGTNYVNVSDATGCSSVGSISISTDASGPKISLKSVIPNNCYGDKAGSLDVNLTGGTKPYNILWSNGATTEDLTGLASGIYDLLVTDNTGCVASASYGVDQPVFLNVSAVVEDASCSGSDGRAVALAGGGIKPYRYLWSNGTESSVANNLAAGIYTLTLTDNKNCSIVAPVIINNTGGPKVSLNKLTGASCTNAASGSIDISVSGGTPLYSYSWMPGGQTTQDVNSLSEGINQITVTDKSGCIGFSSFIIEKDGPMTNPICLVTVDSTTGKCVVVWEKLSQPDVAFYNIYRESSSLGLFQLISTRPANEPGEYLDEVADPSLRSWRYKISTVDDCGNESELSESHKTIHLTQNVSSDRKVNLIWDNYEGFNVATYKISRFTAKQGWIQLASLPGDLTSFKDDKALIEEELLYEIEVENPNGPCSTLKASTYNTTRSNRQSTVVKSTTGVKDLGNLNSIRIFPNPASSKFTLEFNQVDLHKVAVEILDSKGQVMRNYLHMAESDNFRTDFDINGISPGIYMLKISSDNNVNYRKLIIQP